MNASCDATAPILNRGSFGIFEVGVERHRDQLGTEFEGAYLRHYRDVYRYVLGLTRDLGGAEDLVAATFERAFRAWKRPGGPPDPALPWLLVIARHLATDRWRRGRRSIKAMISPGARPAADAGEARTEFWMWFDAVAVVLTDRQREVLLLRYQRELSDEDIGSIMHMSESAVRSLVSRALAALRSHPELLR